MTQMMIESLTHEEYCHLLSYGEPCTLDDRIQPDGRELSWISTLESTTYPDLTFGYIDQL